MATAAFTVFFDIFDGLLPAVFVFGDVFLQVIGEATKYSQLGITACKLLFTLIIIIYL
jgi:hypothetical protein